MSQWPLREPSGCLNALGVPQAPHGSAEGDAGALSVPHVAFFDTRAVPDVGAMKRVARMANVTSPPHSVVQFHAIVASRRVKSVHRDLPGFYVHGLRLSAAASCLYGYLSKSSHGPGPQYLNKVFLPWILPRSVRRVLVLDTDVAVLGNVRELWGSFRRFEGAVAGLAKEQNDLYAPMVGRNGGLQLLDLERMRDSRTYLHFLDTFNLHGYKIGYLGDQTFYTVLGHIHPSLVYTVGCEWNRQLNTHFGADIGRFGKCERGCAMLHANQAPVKCLVRQLQRRAGVSCPQWRHVIESGSSCVRMSNASLAAFRGALKVHFAQCCRSTMPTRLGEKK
jgi:hypothetical protein